MVVHHNSHLAKFLLIRDTAGNILERPIWFNTRTLQYQATRGTLLEEPRTAMSFELGIPRAPTPVPG